MKVALAQLNPTIGDVRRNTDAILRCLAQSAAAGAELVLFAEQAILGYPAKDLLLRREVIQRNVDASERIAAACRGIAAVFGYAEPNPTAIGRPLFNTAALAAGGAIVARWRKQLLPTYDVFDEARYFEPAGPQPVVEFGGRRLAVTVCEDLLAQDFCGRRLYRADPAGDAAAGGADLLLNCSASPFFLAKHGWRLQKLGAAARRARCPVVWVNQVGGNDDVLFDGASCSLDANGGLVAQARAFEEDLLIVDVDRLVGARVETLSKGPAELYDALVMGLRDYVRKCGFRSVVLGLSGGIDSAVVGALAAAALGPENVRGVAMPSRFSSEHSLADARALAENLGIRLSVIEIEPLHTAFEAVLAPHFEGRPPDITEENVQARIRGALLMALSNKFGTLLLTTGNKSELAVGYCTLYGDMCGGLAVISDVPKTMVYALARHINKRSGRAIIPERTIRRAPSAELRPNQTDQDTLPAYDALDAVVERYDEQLQSADEIIAAGIAPAAVVQDLVRRLHRSEYKRQQAAPGLKVTSRAFGFGRRMPIAAEWPG
ncbi:MAG: NAD+ synthase [Phycisphaerae bacterium]